MKANEQSGKSKQNYGTPWEFIQAVKLKLPINDFTVDLAADELNAKAAFFYTEEDDALIQDWSQWVGMWCWLNPPFEDITPWVEKAYKESLVGAQVAMLVPLSIAQWWLDWVDRKAYVFMLNGRITFEGETKPYPKDCALLLYTPSGMKGYEVWKWR